MSVVATTELTALPRSPSLPTFFDNLDSFAEAPEGVAKLRELILDLAVRGKLVEQDENDEPASDSVAEIKRIKSRLLDAKNIQKDKKFAPTVASDPPWEISDSWSWVRLQDAFEVVRGGSPRPAGDPRYFGGDIPWITVREITKDDNKFLTETRDCLTELGSQRSRFVHPDDLLLTNSGATLGVPKINKITGCINDGVAFLNCFHDLIDKEYAYYFLTQQTPAFRAVNQGMGQPNLNTPILAGWFFPIPPLSEQRRIVSKVDGLMSLCDELESRGSERVRLRERASRSCLERLVRAGSSEDLASAWQRLSDHFEVLYDTPETLAHLRQSILQLAVQGKLVPQNPNDEPANVIDVRNEHAEQWQNNFNGKTYKPPVEANPVSDEVIPHSWCWASTDEIADPAQPISYGILKPGPFVDDGVRMLRIMDLKNGVVSDTNVHRVSTELSDQYSRTLLSGGEVLISLVGTIGLCAIVPTNFAGANIHRNLGVIKPGAYATAEFLLCALNSGTIHRQVSEATKGGNQPLFNLGDLKPMAIPLPPLAEQKRIVAKVDQLLSQCDELSARLRERQSATQQLLTATIHQILHLTPPGHQGTQLNPFM